MATNKEKKTLSRGKDRGMFLELKSKGEMIVVNTTQIITISPRNIDTCWIETSRGLTQIDWSYEELRDHLFLIESPRIVVSSGNLVE